ncbi:MAG: 2-dehydropantoate 2-reductase [Polyangiaceae bacterium]|nr:2-dehydropantoate 2-reductase [Polyangiaceae bacterium]
MSRASLHVGIVGAGAIGGFFAAELIHAGCTVALLGRSDRADALPCIRWNGERLVPSAPQRVTGDYAVLREVSVCLVTLKSTETRAAAAKIANHLPPGAPVVSFQNGLDNCETLRAELGARVAAGVVGYNVNASADGVRRQATSGKLYVDALTGEPADHLRSLSGAFTRGGDQLELRRDIDAVVSGKLLLNLNNGVCAATGLGIEASIADPDARWCFAEAIREALVVLRAAGYRPARVATIPPPLLAHALSLPDWIVGRLARAIARVGPDARSSTLQDLDNRKTTEIRSLNGAIVNLAKRVGRPAPANDAVTSAVIEHERSIEQGASPRFVPPRELRRRIESMMKR